MAVRRYGTRDDESLKGHGYLDGNLPSDRGESHHTTIQRSRDFECYRIPFPTAGKFLVERCTN